MKSITQLFHYISYLQYPLMLLVMFHVLQPYFNEFHDLMESLNNALIFMGLSISFSTLQDTTKTQNEMSRKIWEHPVKGKVFLIFMGLLVLFFIGSGITGMFYSDSESLQTLAFGLIVLGIGLIGMLKAASEMFENHRLDKKKP